MPRDKVDKEIAEKSTENATIEIDMYNGDTIQDAVTELIANDIANNNVIEVKSFQDIVNIASENELGSSSMQFRIGIDPQTVFTVSRKED